MKKDWTKEALFCLKYLYQRGYCEGWNIEDENLLLQSARTDYQLVQLPGTDFFSQLAHELRELWPAGDKDDKYPWRDSEANLVKRLQTLWSSRHLKDYSLDFCLEVARRYLAKFRTSTKYMQLLKYFIYKQDEITETNGRKRYVYNSRFADMLEGKDAEDAVLNEWAIVANQTTGEGVLV